jgi:hypothetical protein
MADIESKPHLYPETNGTPTATLAGEKSSSMDMTIDDEKQFGIFYNVTQFLLRWGIETHG